MVATPRAIGCDTTEAVTACEVALSFDAADDRALCNMAKAHERAGRHAEKEATILRLKSLQEDLPPRTVEVMRRNGWLARGA